MCIRDSPWSVAPTPPPGAPYEPGRLIARQPTRDYRLALVELDVPVQIVSPAFWRLPTTDGNPDGCRTHRPAGHADNAHPGLGRGPSPLATVAPDTSGHDVLPVLPPAIPDRYHMIESETVDRKRLSTVLAGVVVASIDVYARERHQVEVELLIC